MEQNNFMGLVGSSFLNIYNKNHPTIRKNITIQIIGNPNNTKRQIFQERSGFSNICPEIFFIIIAFSTLPPRFIMAGWESHYYRAKCADIMISGWSFACPSEGGRVQGWESAFWGGFRDMVFVQYVPYFSRSQRIKNRSPKNTKMPRQFKLIPTYWTIAEVAQTFA